MERPVIYLATDHAGLGIKNDVRDWLLSEDFTVEDCGAHTYNAEDDFPDFIQIAAAAVAAAPAKRKAIIFGGSGQGEAMQANRFKGVRAAVYYGGDPEIITLSRQHNDANVLSIGARFVSPDLAKEMIWKWLHTGVSTEEKYRRRNLKLDRFKDKDRDET